MSGSYRVLLVKKAEQDLAEIVAWIAEHDSPGHADHVLGQLLEICSRLETQPARGRVPPELAAIGVKDYREVRFKPYRVIYQPSGRKVVVHVIADGRRSLQNLLEHRLLR
ncbi:MAG: type II toxin-antitoxin system RelE/ParE family toxin [Chromatiales bacterium]|nr:MAG: type II toxin-antitoxin system RelE/ParE family toxin [Chromatiales bacterium]